MKIINVKTKPEYPVMIGKDKDLEAMCKQIAQTKPPGKIGLISNARIKKLHLNQLLQELAKVGIEPEIFMMREGEKFKNYEYAGEFLQLLISRGFDRSSSLIAFGGGVIGDFTGYLAACYQRGIPFYQIPTTFLAAVDASVGGKVAVNIGSGKNMIGYFHQPKLVAVNLDFFSTLADLEWQTGWAEVIKHALIKDRVLYSKLLKNKDILDKNPAFIIEQAVIRSVSLKASVVQQDEKEKGLRQILNFGHTLGHAIESFQSYKGLTHGQAVAAGMSFALLLSREIYNFPERKFNQALELIQCTGLPLKAKVSAGDLLKHMAYDKKNTAGKNSFVLLKDIGNCVYGKNIDNAILNEMLVKWSAL